MTTAAINFNSIIGVASSGASIGDISFEMEDNEREHIIAVPDLSNGKIFGKGSAAENTWNECICTELADQKAWNR